MADPNPVGPTEIEIDFGGLARTAATTATVAQHAGLAERRMAQSQIGPTAFGLMNIGLGSAVVPIGNRARALAAALSESARRTAENSHILARRWQETEREVVATTRELINVLHDV
jgi:hypothetical protein